LDELWHTAFAAQTGLRLESPTGAFMPYGHRRPFWYSFVRAKEYIFGGNAFCKSHRICPTRLRSAPEAFSTYKKAAAPNGAAAFAFAMIKQKT